MGREKLGGAMQATARVREHQVVFCGLEVLRLIGERMEDETDVDGQDVQVVLGFMRDVVHRCLDNTDEILRFASLEQNVARHRQAKSMFEELTRAEGREFATACRIYADLLAHSIAEDRRCLCDLDCDALTLSQFYEWEHEIAILARPHGQMLHQLEMKYTSPHCI
jgi:hypothetical protein